jgi:hypothetical protein
LILVSVVFALTACAYGVLAVHRIAPRRSPDPAPLGAATPDASGAGSRVSSEPVAAGFSHARADARATARASAPETSGQSARDPWLLEQLDRHGAVVLLIELAVLAATAMAVVATDRGNAT